MDLYLNKSCKIHVFCQVMRFFRNQKSLREKLEKLLKKKRKRPDVEGMHDNFPSTTLNEDLEILNCHTQCHSLVCPNLVGM